MNEKKKPKGTTHLGDWLNMLAGTTELNVIQDWIKKVAGESGFTVEDAEKAFDGSLPLPPKEKADKLAMWKDNVRLKIELYKAKKRIQELEEKLREE